VAAHRLRRHYLCRLERQQPLTPHDPAGGEIFLQLLPAENRRGLEGGMVSDKKSPFSLGKARETAITGLIVIIVLKIVLWALIPFIPYLVSAVVLTTVLGVMLYRTNRF
jgi:CHASE2 domain-containing sensor protein